jgi:flagellar motor switch protein FliM
MDADELKKEQMEKRVKVYDFKRALRFSKDQIRSLTRIHENFARLLTTYFSAQLRTYVQISVATADQIPYEEFIRSIPKMTILNVFEVPPLEGRVIMEVNPNVAYAMMDRMLGGKGESINKIGNLTEIETKIMSSMFERACEYMKEAWENIADIDPVVSEFEVNPQFLQTVSPNETVVVISLNTVIAETQGMINICIPHVVLEPVIPKLSVHYWMQNQNKTRSPEEIKRLEGHVQQALLPVSVELGTSHISVQDFLMLSAGDVIELNQAIEKPLLIKVGNIPKFVGQAGKNNKRLAVQVLDSWKGRGSHDE